MHKTLGSLALKKSAALLEQLDEYKVFLTNAEYIDEYYNDDTFDSRNSIKFY